MKTNDVNYVNQCWLRLVIHGAKELLSTIVTDCLLLLFLLMLCLIISMVMVVIILWLLWLQLLLGFLFVSGCFDAVKNPDNGSNQRKTATNSHKN